MLIGRLFRQGLLFIKYFVMVLFCLFGGGEEGEFVCFGGGVVCLVGFLKKQDRHPLRLK